MLQDYKLGLRMLLKYPGLTVAGGLALAIAIGVGATWYDVTGKILSPSIPLPDGHRLVTIETQNAQTVEPERRVAREFLEWRRDVRTIEELGAFRTESRNFVAGNGAPQPVRMAEITAAAFQSAHVSPLLGRPLLPADDAIGAAPVVILSYDVWQRALGGRMDVVGSIALVGGTSTTVIGVMPEGFAYPVNHEAWTPLRLRASYRPFEGGPIGVIGRLAPGVEVEQANAELSVLGGRTARALPATHEHLRPRVLPLGDPGAAAVATAQTGLRNLPVLLILLVACLSVGMLVYARTATREGEIAVRSALGAGRARIVAQLFVESFVLASIAGAAGLVGAHHAVSWGVDNFDKSSGGVPFWITPGLRLSTILYAGVLAAVSAAMLSILPALRATRARLHTHLAERGSGATLRFGRVWTGAMIVQVALTAVVIPVAMEAAHEARLKLSIRASFPSRAYVVARLDLDRPLGEDTAPPHEEPRARIVDGLTRRLAQEPGVVALAYADRVPGKPARSRPARVEPPGALPYDDASEKVAVGPGYFEALNRPIVAGRQFQAADWNPAARTVVVNEAFARTFARQAGGGSPIGSRLKYPDASYQIVGVVRNVGLDPDDSGDEQPFVFHATPVGAMSSLVVIVRTGGNPSALAARLPFVAPSVDPRLMVRDAETLDASIRERDTSLAIQAGAFAALTLLVLFLSALGIFSLVSVSVSRRTREIGLRAALGASAGHVLNGIVSQGAMLMGSGLAAGGALLLLVIAIGGGPSGRPADDLPLFAVYLVITAVVMLAACLLACIGPAGRALRINPTDALREG
jgi:putative ABC transport system permease protein